MKTQSENFFVDKFIPKNARAMINRWKNFSPHTITIMFKTSFSIICLILFAKLTFSLLNTESSIAIQSFDESILKWVETLRTPFLNAMMVDITSLGGLALTVILGLLTVFIFLIAGDPAAAIHLIITATGGFYISLWTKSLILRPRPTIIPQLIHASGFSYPSGHATTSAAIYLTMAILTCRHFKSYNKRFFLLFLAAIMITLISFSRIYLGVHYPSDTMSGALIGLAWALFMAALFSKLHFHSGKY